MITKINKKKIIILKELCSAGRHDDLPMTSYALSKEIGRTHKLIVREIKAVFLDYKDKRPYYIPCYDPPVKTYKFTQKGLEMMIDFYLTSLGMEDVFRISDFSSHAVDELNVYYEDVRTEKMLNELTHKIARINYPGGKKKEFEKFIRKYCERYDIVIERKKEKDDSD